MVKNTHAVQETSIPRLGRFPWRRERLPTPAFFLENPVNKKVWQAAVHGIAKS